MKTQTILVTIQPEHKAFIKAAAESAGCSVSHLARKALVHFSAGLLGKDAPVVSDIKPGAVNPFAAEAAAAGLTPKGYMRKVACEAKGFEFKARKGESLSDPKPAKKEKAAK